mgnify:CR=1 FL=1
MRKNTENQPGGEILLYQTEDGRTRIAESGTDHGYSL